MESVLSSHGSYSYGSAPLRGRAQKFFFDARGFRYRAPDSRCGDRKIFRFSQTDQKLNDYDYDCRLQAAKTPRDYKTVTLKLKNAYSSVFRRIYVKICVFGDYNRWASSTLAWSHFILLSILSIHTCSCGAPMLYFFSRVFLVIRARHSPHGSQVKRVLYRRW